MFCKHCGSELKEETDFCPKCGKPLKDSEIPPINNNQQKPRSVVGTTLTVILTIIGVVIVGGLLVVFVILPIVCTPRFTSIKDEATQSSCRANMHQIATAENMYYAVANCYTDNPKYLEPYIGGGNVWNCPKSEKPYKITVSGTDQFSIPCPSYPGNGEKDHGTVTDTGASW